MVENGAFLRQVKKCSFVLFFLFLKNGEHYNLNLQSIPLLKPPMQTLSGRDLIVEAEVFIQLKSF